MWYFYFGLFFAGFAQTTDGAFYFTREPAKEVYFLKGSDASFQWNYTVEDRAAEFQFIIWKAQNVTTRTFYPLINEKENFDVAVSSRIPLAYVGRVEKKGEATLVIKSVNFEDSTTYRCLLQAKDARSNQSDVQLHVTGSVSASPKVQCAEEGGSATFTCTARAVPSQNFTWLQQEGTQRIVDGERYSIVSSSGLSRVIIKNVSAADHGFYVCDATMNLKQPNKAVFYLQVPCVDPPKEDRTFCRETSYSLALGDNQTICCPVSGYPPPFITWSKNGARVNNENSVLKIYSLMDEDYGNYTCTATDFRTSFGPINITIIKKAGLSLDVIDGTAEKPAKLEIQRLPEAKVYVVKISGQVIHDDYLVGAKTSLEFHYHSLVMKTGSERPEQVKIQVEVSAMNDKGYKLVEASTRELIVKRPSDTEY